jgi:hypothetical protein
MTIRSVARWAFVNAAGTLPDYSLAFSKVAYWIRFSKWYMATGAKISKFDVSTREESGRKAMYERVAKENLGQEAILSFSDRIARLCPGLCSRISALLSVSSGPSADRASSLWENLAMGRVPSAS